MSKIQSILGIHNEDEPQAPRFSSMTVSDLFHAFKDAKGYPRIHLVMNDGSRHPLHYIQIRDSENAPYPWWILQSAYYEEDVQTTFTVSRNPNLDPMLHMPIVYSDDDYVSLYSIAIRPITRVEHVPKSDDCDESIDVIVSPWSYRMTINEFSTWSFCDAKYVGKRV